MALPGEEIVLALGMPGRAVAAYIEYDLESNVEIGHIGFGIGRKRVCLEHAPEAGPGDCVLVHGGFTPSRIDADEAQRIFSILQEMEKLDEPDSGSVKPS